MPSLGKLINVCATADPQPGLHYRLSCYVCGPGCHRPAPFEGWATFAQIFASRPNGCRFAVARKVTMNVSGIQPVVGYDDELGPWVVWDLLDDRLTAGRFKPDGLLRPPDPLWVGPHEDALIMKAMALYDRPA